MSEGIYTLVGEYKELFALLTDADEQDEDIIKDSLESVIGAIEVKSQGYVAVLDRLDMEINACKKENEEWARKLAVRENAVKRLKQRMAEAMIQMDKDELQAGNKTIKLKNNGGKKPLVFEENKEVPESYMKVILEPDKERIREDLENGKELEFAHIGERGKHIEIR